MSPEPRKTRRSMRAQALLDHPEIKPEPPAEADVLRVQETLQRTFQSSRVRRQDVPDAVNESHIRLRKRVSDPKHWAAAFRYRAFLTKEYEEFWVIFDKVIAAVLYKFREVRRREVPPVEPASDATEPVGRGPRVRENRPKNINMGHRLQFLATVEPDSTDLLMKETLAALPPRQRNVLIRRHLDNATVAEIAEELGCSPAKVRRELRAGVKALRSALSDD